MGGHDHVYWISKGVTKWDGYNVHKLQPDATDDRGDVLVVKSGVDYQDLSEIILTLKDTPAGSVRKKIIQDMTGGLRVTFASFLTMHPRKTAYHEGKYHSEQRSREDRRR